MTTTPAMDEATVVALAHANYVEFSRELARWSGAHGEIAERDGCLLFATGTEFPVTCNGVVRIDPTVSAGAVLEVADAWFGTKGRGYSVATVELDDRDEDLRAAAEARGLLRIMDSPAMVCEARLADAVAPAGVELRWIDQPAQVADAVAINDAAYQSLGMPAQVIVDQIRVPEAMLAPHVRTVVAYEGEVPLATAQVLLSHGIAGVYYVGTVDAARGRGLAELVTRAVTNEGFDRGAAFVTLQASSMGEPIYRRMGYRDAYRYVTHARFA